MSEQVVTRAADPAFISSAEIKSNGDGATTIDIANGIQKLEFYESILQDSIRATIVFNDSGDSVSGKTAVDGLPLSLIHI